MRITKQNYNELRTQELDNNFAKVWHVNEIREELLANTPTGGVTEITNTTTAYSESVALGTSNFSIIDTDHKIQVQDNGVDGFNLISKVPYHEVIGTITFPADIGTGIPTVNVQVNTALADFPDLANNTFTPATWDMEKDESIPGIITYKLKMTNKVSALYYGGIFNTSLIIPASSIISSAVPYQLITNSLFDGASVNMCVVLSYVSSEDLKTRLANLNNNPEMIFQFHLILPID